MKEYKPEWPINRSDTPPRAPTEKELAETDPRRAASVSKGILHKITRAHTREHAKH